MLASLLASVAVSAVSSSIAVSPSIAVSSSIAAAKSGLVGKLAGAGLWVKAAASVAVLSVASASTFVYVRRHVPALGAARALAPLAVPQLAPPVSIDVTPGAAKVSPKTQRALAPRSRAVDEPSPELRLLRQAHEARHAGRPERALELANEQAKRYPNSSLWSEREALRVLALCDLGRVDAARRTAAPLQYLWSSPVQATLNASCVGK